MKRCALALSLLCVLGSAAAANPRLERLLTTTKPKFRRWPAEGGRGPLSRTTLLREVAAGQRALIGHDPQVRTIDDAQSRFLVVRDIMAGRGGPEHVLGIFTPPSGQPQHIADVSLDDAQDLGRMVRGVLFADHAQRSRGAHSRWEVAFHLNPSVDMLHLHGAPGSSYREPADWDAFLARHRYVLQKQGRGFKVYARPGGDAPNDWNVIAIAEPRFGAMRDLDGVPPEQASSVDRLVGEMFIETARAARGGFQVEASRTDGRIVVRTSGFGIDPFFLDGPSGPWME